MAISDDNNVVAMASMLTLGGSQSCQCFAFRSLFGFSSTPPPPNLDATIRAAYKSLDRIGRNLEKIDVLLVGFTLPDEDRYRKFLRICEEEIEQDLEDVQLALDGLKKRRTRDKSYHDEYTVLLGIYNDTRSRIQCYVDT